MNQESKPKFVMENGVGLVSQAFRKNDKYTDATLMRVNPVLAYQHK